MSSEITDQKYDFSLDINRKFASLCADLTDSLAAMLWSAMDPEHGVYRVAKRSGWRYTGKESDLRLLDAERTPQGWDV